MSFKVGQLRVVTKPFWGWANGPSGKHDRVNIGNMGQDVLLVLGTPHPSAIANINYVEVLTTHGKQDIDCSFLALNTVELTP